MEVTEKEIMETIGKGEIYRQAAAIHAKLAEVVKIFDNFYFYTENYGRQCDNVVIEFREFELYPAQLAKIAAILQQYCEKATLYSCGCDLRVCVEFN